MSMLISVKVPDKVVLVYGDMEIELVYSSNFELLVFCADIETAHRLSDAGLLAGKKHNGGCHFKHPLES